MIRSISVRLRQWPAISRFRQRMNQPGRRLVTDDGALLPAGMVGHRLELAEACRAALEALDRGGDVCDAPRDHPEEPPR